MEEKRITAEERVPVMFVGTKIALHIGKTPLKGIPLWRAKTRLQKSSAF